MRRVFKTRPFRRWMRKTTLTDAALCTGRLRDGPGAHRRRPGGQGGEEAGGAAGPRGNTRTLVATNKGDRWFFVFGFAKNERAAVSATELAALQRLAHDLLALPAPALEAHVATDALQEICHDDEAAGAQPPPRRGARDRA